MSTTNPLQTNDACSRIINAGIDLLAEKTLGEFTEEDICRRADVATKTFYRYFPSKEALFADLIRDSMFELTGDIFSRAEERYASFADRLQYAMAQIVDSRRDYGETERKYYRAGITEIANSDERVLQLYGFFNDYFQRWLEQGQASGEVTKEFEVGFMAHLATGCLLDINQIWMNDPEFPHLQRHEELAVFLPNFFAA
ncbi:MAG: TetR/AcrR family transcriptional regulator [Cellvibrionales bacterium]|nr:TetR/AcrR family transcriptional regulator [Cellvibrionales bacterium]